MIPSLRRKGTEKVGEMEGEKETEAVPVNNGGRKWMTILTEKPVSPSSSLFIKKLYHLIKVLTPVNFFNYLTC